MKRFVAIANILQMFSQLVGVNIAGQFVSRQF